MEQPSFASINDYAPRFTDAGYWRPYVDAVCKRHSLSPCHNIRAGLPGTFPVFIVDDRYVVKFFGDLFQGPHRYAAELDVYHLIGNPPQIPAPALLGHGFLFPESVTWQWPYLVSTMLPGTSYGEVDTHVSGDDKQALVRSLGQIIRQVHLLPLHDARVLAPSWDAFYASLAHLRAMYTSDPERWRLMPERLVAAFDAYLLPDDQLIDRSSPPHLLHADLTGDHVIGRFEDGHWRMTGIIDFGDAMVGDPLYELVALHIGLHRCDKQLLRAFLDGYGFDQELDRQFVRRAMTYTLLHEFAVLNHVFDEHPAARAIDNLDELAQRLWDPEQPGL